MSETPTPARTLREDALIDNLIGMCAYNRKYQDFPCGQTTRTRGEYCTACEAAERLKTDALLQPSVVETPARAGNTDTVEHLRKRIRTAFNREMDATYTPHEKRLATEAALNALIAAVRAEQPSVVADGQNPRDIRGLSIERADAVRILRQVCARYGDNDWTDDLHLGDVIEKHLWRNLEAFHPSVADGSRQETETK